MYIIMEKLTLRNEDCFDKNILIIIIITVKN